MWVITELAIVLVVWHQNTPPEIRNVMHRPTNPYSTDTVVVRAKIIDDGTIIADSLLYDGGTDTIWVVPHDSVIVDIYYYHIPPLPDNIVNNYSIWAKDDSQAISISSNAYQVGKEEIIINEVYYDSPGNDSCCFIELKGTPGMSLDNWWLVGVNGATGVDYNQIELTGYTMPPDSYFVVAQDAGVPNSDIIIPEANLQNGPDNLQLRYYYAAWQGVVIDGVGYGDFSTAYFAGEWEPTVDVAPGHSIGRKPNEYDTDNNRQDFHEFVTPTPGAPNIGIEETKKKLSLEFTLSPTLTNRRLKIYLPKGGAVQIYDLVGKLAQKIKDETYRGELEWDLKNYQGKAINSGLYFVRYKNIVRKVVVIH